MLFQQEQQLIEATVETLPHKEQEEFTKVFRENERFLAEARHKQDEIEQTTSVKQQLMEVLGRQNVRT